MKQLVLICLVGLSLVACGVDGAPVPPPPEPTPEPGTSTGVTISGSVGAGIRR
ncbi:MAG: argininosuccinate lyase [Dinoroseobacter sp.]|nr:argininosuccinate lyase [Dinoroseobacter sp.]